MADVLRFPGRVAFDPEQTKAMGDAFDVACEFLTHSRLTTHQIKIARDALAGWIMERAQRGETSPMGLADYAITRLKL